MRTPSPAPPTGWALPDAVAWAAGLAAAAALAPPAAGPPAGALLVTAVLCFGLHQLLTRLTPHPRRRDTLGAAVWLAATVLLTAAVVLALTIDHRGVLAPPATSLTGCLLAGLAMLAARAGWRWRRHRAPRPGTPVLLYGTAASAQALARLMRSDPGCRYRPVGVVPDHPVDPAEVEIPVVGDRDDVAAALGRTGARLLLLTSPTPPQRVERLYRQVRSRGAALQTVPETNLLIEGVDESAGWDVAALLGRPPRHTELTGADFLRGRRVLVVGAGGSIGSELCRQVAAADVAELMLLDRDESALHATVLSIAGRALLDGPETILADIRDAALLRRVVATRRPDVVFHAAALKHLPMLEAHPAEAVKTNVLGTSNLLAACAEVAAFVNISTDKAANPTSVLGLSKRVTERLTAEAARRCPGTFLSVRFGNVLGSRGSVLTAFRAQLRAGAPVTVTHPEVTRYFMTVREAVALVLEAAAIGRDGEALILEMGEPVRIVDLARQMAELMGRTPEIVYTGLRPGEKVHEDLFGDGERDARPVHPMVSHVAVPPLDPGRLELLDPAAAPESTRAALADLCAAPAPGDPDGGGHPREPGTPAAEPAEAYL